MDNFLSVIVTVHKNAETVLYLLNEINKQTLQKNLFEVIIIDDFSKENINKIILKEKNNFKFDLRIFRNKENRGVAYTRNQGVKKSKGNVILFLGGDIIPDKNLFFIHFENHGKYHEENIAVLGYVTWSPKISITPFMKWLDAGGPQNSFHEIEDKKWVSDKYFYGSNVSLKKIFLESNGFFNENFKKYGFEDFELGHRLFLNGLKILYLKQAIGYHHHQISLGNVLKREFQAGQNAVLLDKIYPELGFTKPYFIFYKKIARKIVFNPIVTFFTLKLAAFYENKKIYPYLYTRIISLYFFRGVKNGLKFYG